MAMLYLARRLAPAMIAAGEGAIVASGNTSALRGKANFAGFAPTKAAQRILAEAIARELGPEGSIDVAYVVIDAVIDLEWTRVAVAGTYGFVFYQAGSNSRRSLARSTSRPERMVIQCRNQAIWRDLVDSQWQRN